MLNRICIVFGACGQTTPMEILLTYFCKVVPFFFWFPFSFFFFFASVTLSRWQREEVPPFSCPLRNPHHNKTDPYRLSLLPSKRIFSCTLKEHLASGYFLSFQTHFYGGTQKGGGMDECVAAALSNTCAPWLYGFYPLFFFFFSSYFVIFSVDC